MNRELETFTPQFTLGMQLVWHTAGGGQAEEHVVALHAAELTWGFSKKCGSEVWYPLVVQPVGQFESDMDPGRGVVCI